MEARSPSRNVIAIYSLFSPIFNLNEMVTNNYAFTNFLVITYKDPLEWSDSYLSYFSHCLVTDVEW